MSVDIAWETITSGPDGSELAEHIRDFIHTKFQQIALPRFINSVHVHSFEFGTTCPDVEIKDICDPLPDFYEDDESSEGEESHVGDTVSASASTVIPPSLVNPSLAIGSTGTGLHSDLRYAYNTHGLISAAERFAALDLGRKTSNSGSSRRPEKSSFDAGLFHRSGSPTVPGGTSNMGYFHFPVSGLSGAQTPLAAVASGTPLSPHPLHASHQLPFQHLSHAAQDETSAATTLQQSRRDSHNTTSSLRPRTTGSVSSPELGSPLYPSSPANPPSFPLAEKVSDDLSLESMPEIPPMHEHQIQPSDLQVVAHVKYDGDVRMMLTAEILVDYPMPSFVSIPLKLSITGVTFDGVAILAYIKKRMHLCFLDSDDAKTMIGDTNTSNQESKPSGNTGKKAFPGSLLQEIHVESEIGRQEGGKQVLKNVSNVEKFILEQVRRIFEEEFVFPSYWTFLV